MRQSRRQEIGDDEVLFWLRPGGQCGAGQAALEQQDDGVIELLGGVQSHRTLARPRPEAGRLVERFRVSPTDLADFNPPRPIYLVWHSHPTPPERIANARAAVVTNAR